MDESALSFAQSFEAFSRHKSKSGRAQPNDPGTERHKDIENAIARAEEVAALCGEFFPSDLPEPNFALRPLVLTALAAKCAVDASSAEPSWMLHGTARIDILRGLQASGTLPHLLVQPGLPRARDGFGSALRQLLAGQVPGRFTQEQGLAILLAWSAAFDVAEALNIAQRPKDLKFAIAQASASRASNAKLKDFVGRVELLAELEAFARNERARSSDPEFFVLTGAGGAGKSAILRQLDRRLEGTDTLMCVIDFDTPGLHPRDTGRLNSMLSRLIGLRAGAEAYASISSVRQELRATSRFGMPSVGSSAESHDRSNRSTLYEAGKAIDTAGIRILLIAFDTAEEIHAEFVPTLVNWLEALPSAMGPQIAVRCLVTGRLFDEQRAAWQRYLGTRVLKQVDELTHPECLELLARNGVLPEPSQRIAGSRLLPKRPLELKLMSRIVRDQGVTSIDELERDILSGGAAADVLFAGLVYKRVLMRVPEEIRALAHPGLVLRYVTVDLLLEVLVPALDLPANTRVQAQDLLNLLASHAWLAVRDGEKVWHRRDVRRSALLAMAGVERDKAIRIHEHAIVYFEKSGAHVDAMYHRLMLWGMAAGAAAPIGGELDKVAGELGSYAEDLPRPAAVLVDYVRTGDVAVNDLMHLPTRMRDEAGAKLAIELAAAREFRSALSALQCMSVWNKKPLSVAASRILFTVGVWERLGRGEAVTAATYYPMCVVKPTSRNRRELGDLLRNGLDLERDRSPPAQVAEEFAQAAVALASIAPFREEEAAGLARLVTKAVSRMPERPEPAMINKLLVLRLLSDPQHRMEAQGRLSPDSICLDPKWLRRARFLQPTATAAPRLRELVDQVGRATVDADGIEDALTRIDRLALEPDFAAGIEVPLAALTGEEFSRGFLGPIPELRQAGRYAVLDAYENGGDWGQLAGIIAKLTGCNFPDLDPKEFAAAMERDAEHALLRPIELVDRYGRLSELIERVGTATQGRFAKRLRAPLTRWRSTLHKHWEPWLLPEDS